MELIVVVQGFPDSDEVILVCSSVDMANKSVKRYYGDESEVDFDENGEVCSVTYSYNMRHKTTRVIRFEKYSLDKYKEEFE